MGSEQSLGKQSYFEEKVNYISTIQDVQFGTTTIYRMKQPPYDYVMRFTRVMPTQFSDLSKATKILQEIKRKSHRCVAKIHQVQCVEEKLLCNTSCMLDAFCSYYNFTLKQAIQKKKALRYKFSEGELWYVLGTLLDLGQFLQTMELSFGNYNASNVFLSHDGHYLRVYLLAICPDNKHNGYFKALVDQTDMPSRLLSPQQLSGVKNQQYQIRFDVFKSDVFSIGMLILELFAMGSRKFYDAKKVELNLQEINSCMKEIKQLFSEEMFQLLRGCLQVNPKDRLGFNQAMDRIESIRSKISYSGSIKLVYSEEDEEASVAPQVNNLQNRLSTSRVEELKWTPLRIDLKLVKTASNPLQKRRNSLYSSSVTNKSSSKQSTAKFPRTSNVSTSASKMIPDI